MSEKKFVIESSDNNLILNSKICIVKTFDTGKQEIKSLLYKGKKEEVLINYDIGEYYKIYVSYNDSLVTVLEFENILRNHKDPSDILLILDKNNNGDIGIGNAGFQNPHLLIPIDEYLALKRIHSEDSINKEKKLFFDFYGE